jgi:hypothetical protein
VHQQGALRRGLAGQHAGRGGIEGARQCRLGFGPVDGGVHRGIDDDLGLHRAHEGDQRFRLGEVHAKRCRAVDVAGHDVAQWCQGPLQLPADLTVLAQQKDLHRVG